MVLRKKKRICNKRKNKYMYCKYVVCRVLYCRVFLYGYLQEGLEILERIKWKLDRNKVLGCVCSVEVVFWLVVKKLDMDQLNDLEGNGIRLLQGNIVF